MSGFTKWFISESTPGFGSFDSTYDFITNKTGFIDNVLKPALVDGTAQSNIVSVKLLSDTQLEITTDGSYYYQQWSCLLISGESTYSEINQECQVYQIVDSTTFRLTLSEGITALTLGVSTAVNATVKVAPIGWPLYYSDTTSSTNTWIFGTKPEVDMQLFFRFSNTGNGYLKLDQVGPSYVSGNSVTNGYAMAVYDPQYDDVALVNPYQFLGNIKKYFIIGNEEGFYIGAFNCASGDTFSYIGRLSTMFNLQSQTKFYWVGIPNYSRLYLYNSSITNQYWSFFPKAITAIGSGNNYGCACGWTNLNKSFVINTNQTLTNSTNDVSGQLKSTIIFKDVPVRLEVNRSYLLYPGAIEHISINTNGLPSSDNNGSIVEDGEDLYWMTYITFGAASNNNGFMSFVIDLKNKWNQSNGFISSVPSFT